MLVEFQYHIHILFSVLLSGCHCVEGFIFKNADENRRKNQ